MDMSVPAPDAKPQATAAHGRGMGFKILFVGMNNTCRTPMAEGFARKLGLRAESAGTMPGKTVTPAAVAAMQDKGIDISSHRPKRFQFPSIPDYDRVIIIGDDVTRSHPNLEAHENWHVTDVLGQPLRSYQEIRDAIERKVHALRDELNEWQRA